MSSNEQPTETIRILMSDNADIGQAIADAQQNGEHYDTVAVRDGLKVLDILQEQEFDLVIIDLSMPRLDGLRLTALIRATPALKDLPILAIASPQEPGSTLESIRAGADDYVARPIEWPLLAMRIRQLSRGRQR